MNDPYLTDHFQPLREASTAILSALREDESSPQSDLYKRLVVNGGSRYHVSVNCGEGGRNSVNSPRDAATTTNTGTNANTGATREGETAPSNHLIHSHSIPLPPPLAHAMQNAKISTSMGLHPESNLVWAACDHVLFLWRHGSSVNNNSDGGLGGDAAAGGGVFWGGMPSLPRKSCEDVCSFEVPDGQCVVGVGVVRPKKGVFKPTIQHCIIISTPQSVTLCALSLSPTLRLIPTRFILPTDNVPMISIAGSKSGRIFMGGYDGCLYEMHYEAEKTQVVSVAEMEERIDDYFDGEGGLNFNSSSENGIVAGGKRIFSALTFGSLEDGPRKRRKCSKINHSASGIASKMPVVRAIGIFGSSMESAARKGGPIVSLVLDEERACLYTLGANGIICTYDLVDRSNPEKDVTPRLACVLDSVATAKLYLQSVSIGRMYPPSTTQSVELGTITFPGGIHSAQAGVGGMEGAQEIMKRHEREVKMGSHGVASSAMNPREIANSAGILHPVSIHLVAGEESKSLTLVAVTGGGLRYYLSSLTSSYMSSAQASQGNFDYATRGNDSKLTRTRPSKKMTFCHIRAPPPYTTSDGNDGLKIEIAPSTKHMLRLASGSGIPPGIHNNPSSRGATGESRKGDVVRSFYGKDIFVLALDVEKGNNTARNATSQHFFGSSAGERKSAVGDALVVALTDTAARVTDPVGNTNSSAITVHNGVNNQARTVSGGISEISILPMAGVGGTSSPVLSGGTTFDVSSQDNKHSSVVSLFANSETPSDSELQIGLMPSFTPPKAKPRVVNPTPGMSTALVVHGSSQGRGVISSALSTISNYLRNGQGIGYQVPSVSGPSGGLRPSATFRVSRRHGCDAMGFSSSSAEIISRPGSRTSTSRSTTPKSARLPSWLMAPSAAPLSFQSSMHLTPPGSDSVLVLNAGGLHFFTNSSLLNNLASVLLRASNVAKDESVKNFFTSYGFPEGCAMCFALATSNSSNSNLRSKAEQAALTHAHTPHMKLTNSGTGGDPLSSYQFQPSSLYEGLVKFSSRLLRPFWYKVAVVVTEGRPIQSKFSLYGKYYSAVPAKVELLLDDVVLDEIRRPLIMLQDLMKKTFVPVVHSVPGAKNPTDSMDVDDDMNSGGLITRALQNQSRAAQRMNNANQPHDLTLEELRKIAFDKEDRNMHSVYRLWSRCIQMLNLMTCLKRAHSSPALPEVQWGLLHGLTFCQLVTTFEGQQRVETLLNALFSQSENSLVSDISTEGDLLADALSHQCYLYFSSASRLTYLGFKSARDAMSRSTISSQRKLLSNKAASYLRAAARHWHDPALVVGRLASNNIGDDWQSVAKSAIDNGSPLALAADELMKLENAQGLADVCLICAANFGGAKVLRDNTKELGESPVEGMFDWEKGLYQQPPPEKLANNKSDQSTSSQAIVISGIQATPLDALKACHSILFYHISKLLGVGGTQNQRLAEEIVAVCASSSDVKFLRSLYDLLSSTNNVDTLLRIDSSTLESWLKEKNDVSLLWRYYSFHSRNILAGDAMYNMAIDTAKKTPLAQRIECLTRAANSFSAALQSQNATGQVSISDLKARITQIHEQLDVSAIQQQVLGIVQQSQNCNLDTDKMDALSHSLVNVSDIYNEYAAPLNLFDICLLLMETCRRNDPDHISTLWRSILCEELLPCGTMSRVAYDFLNEIKDGSIVQEEILFGEVTDDTFAQFDNGSWIPRLKARVSDIGMKLYGKGADYTFPLDLLLETLEGLRHVQTKAGNAVDVSHPWPAQIMLDVGVPYYTILATYQGLQGVVGGDESSQLQNFIWMIELLELWVTAALSNNDFSGSTNNPSVQLVQAINQDRLLVHINSLRSALEDMNGVNANQVEHVHSRLVEIQDTIERNFR